MDCEYSRFNLFYSPFSLLHSHIYSVLKKTSNTTISFPGFILHHPAHSFYRPLHFLILTFLFLFILEPIKPGSMSLGTSQVPKLIHNSTARSGIFLYPTALSGIPIIANISIEEPTRPIILLLIIPFLQEKKKRKDRIACPGFDPGTYCSLGTGL